MNEAETAMGVSMARDDRASKVYTVVRKTWLSQKPRSSSLVVTLFITFLLVLASLIATQNWFGAAEWMKATKESALIQGETWRLWTTLFVHGDAKHLISNCFFFFIFGYFLFGYFGFFLFPVVPILMGGLTSFVVLSNMRSEVTGLVGISGVVFWMAGAWLVLYTCLDRRRSVFQRILRAVGVGLALFLPSEAFDPSTSYQSHLVGFLLGIGFAIPYFFARKQFFRSREVVETVVEEDDLENSVVQS